MKTLCSCVSATISPVNQLKEVRTDLAARELAEFESIIPASAEETYNWHWQPGTMERLIPPWENVTILKRAAGPEDGQTAILRITAGPFKIDWLAKHKKPDAAFEFVDYQESGPFAYWKHRHIIEPIDSDSCRLVDRIEYELPFAFLSSPFAGKMVRKKIERMFAYRHEITKCELGSFKQLQGRVLKILLSGSNGLVCRQLSSYLNSQGHELSKLTRVSGESADELYQSKIFWDPQKEILDSEKLAGFDLFIHLLVDRNFHAASLSNPDNNVNTKSRIDATRFLCNKLASLKRKAKLLIIVSDFDSCSDRADRFLDENISSDSELENELSRNWQEAAAPACKSGVRVVFLKAGLILNSDLQALRKSLSRFRRARGAKPASAKRYLSWVSIYDLVAIVQHVMLNENLSGPVNAVAPVAVTNTDLERIIDSLSGQAFQLPLQAHYFEDAFAEASEDQFLAGAAAEPTKLIESDYRFRHADIESCLRFLFGIV